MDKEKTINDLQLEEEALSDEEKLLIQIQKIAVKMELIETKVPSLPLDKQDKLLEEYYELKAQHKELKQELKSHRKKEGMIWDKIPIWMYIYAIILFILNFPILSSLIWIRFSNITITIFEFALKNIDSNTSDFVNNLVSFLIVYSLPLITLLSSSLLYIYAIKKPESRRVFKYIYLSQILFFLITAIWIYFNFLKGILL